MVGVLNPLSPLEAGVTPPTPMVLIPRTKNVRLLRYLRIFAYSSLNVLAKSGCFKCGEEGHRKSECPKAGDEEPRRPKVDWNEAKTHTITKEDGTTQEIYIPTEVADDDLFQQGISSGINFDKFDKIPVSTYNFFKVQLSVSFFIFLQVKCSGDNAPPPAASFESMGLRQILRDNIEKSGYKRPTPIQKYAIPIIANKRDLMACAQTGSGKTAAFLLPILHNILEDECDPHSGDCPQKPQAVVVAPTRELALQIKEEARKFALQSVAKAVVAYGGTSTGFQMSQLFKGCNVLIATPGRLMDFVEKGKVSFEDCRYLVLDEADRMLDMVNIFRHFETFILLNDYFTNLLLNLAGISTRNATHCKPLYNASERKEANFDVFCYLC